MGADRGARLATLSPVERPCPDCNGVGSVPGNAWARCKSCDGIGRAFIEGGPLFGCRMSLGERNRGEIVTLGNGDRGRILWHDDRGTPTTFIGLIGDFSGVESHQPTMYPSSTGVASVADPRWFTDTQSHAHDRSDSADPLRSATKNKNRKTKRK